MKALRSSLLILLEGTRPAAPLERQAHTGILYYSHNILANMFLCLPPAEPQCTYWCRCIGEFVVIRDTRTAPSSETRERNELCFLPNQSPPRINWKGQDSGQTTFHDNGT